MLNKIDELKTKNTALAKQLKGGNHEGLVSEIWRMKQEEELKFDSTNEDFYAPKQPQPQQNSRLEPAKSQPVITKNGREDLPSPVFQIIPTQTAQQDEMRIDEFYSEKQMSFEENISKRDQKGNSRASLTPINRSLDLKPTLTKQPTVVRKVDESVQTHP